MIGPFIAFALAAEGPIIQEYLKARIRAYDESGVAIAPISKEDLPKPPVKIVGTDAKGRPGVRLSGGTVYFSSADVLTKGFAAPCQRVSTAPRDNLRAAGDTPVGASGGLAVDALPCY